MQNRKKYCAPRQYLSLLEFRLEVRGYKLSSPPTPANAADSRQFVLKKNREKD